MSNQLAAAVRAALRTPTFIDYRRSFPVAGAAEAVLDMLESRLDTGEADLARPALLRAVTRLRKVLEHADDSSGVIGAAGQRAARLYARSCREGHPDRIALARWLVRFRVESPGWPDLTLADFVAAFDERAWRSTPRTSRQPTNSIATTVRGSRWTGCCWSSPIMMATSIAPSEC